SAGTNRDVWLVDVARAVSTRFTFEPGVDALAVWAPDSSRLAFRNNLDIFQKTSSGSGSPEFVLESDTFKTPQEWAPDGRYLLYRNLDLKTGRDLWVLPLFGDRKPIPFLVTNYEERDGQFSPDGHWIAYASNESGRFEIYIQPFPGPGGKWQVSTGGGSQ